MLILAATLPFTAFDLFHVDDPAATGALASSATGSVIVGPPAPGVPYHAESVPIADDFTAIEGVQALNADVWHAEGHTGQGVSVAVFDLEWDGAELDPQLAGHATTHDCWFTPTCEVPMDTARPRFSYEEGNHGVACAEVVHAIAPDADLHLVRVNGETTLENAIHWAVRSHIDVISMSLSFFNASFYDGRGRIDHLVDKLVDANILLVVSAGNYARGHWLGAWTDGDGDGRMDFAGDNGIWVHLNAGAHPPYVSWDQYGSCGTTDLDVWVFDEQGQIAGRSEDRQDVGADRCEPMERLSGVTVAGWYFVEVRHIRGPTAGLRVNLLTTDGAIAGGIEGGSVTDPGTHPRALTVGAVRAVGYDDNPAEAFSSRGPTADGRYKPDIAGPDGLSVGPYGAMGFFGTSAAAPAVAGAIAVAMSGDPSLGPYDAADLLKGSALGDAAVFGPPDPALGAGRARLPVDAAPMPCGHRPLLMPLIFAPLGWRRSRRHPRRAPHRANPRV